MSFLSYASPNDHYSVYNAALTQRLANLYSCVLGYRYDHMNAEQSINQ